MKTMPDQLKALDAETGVHFQAEACQGLMEYMEMLNKCLGCH